MMLLPHLSAPAADLAIPVPRITPAQPPGIAVIPIHGTRVKRVLGMEAASGLTSYGGIAQEIDAALADPQVQGILLDIDSPGGEASGSFELARKIRHAATQKPLWAVANDAAYSAAYALAASAQRLIVTETGGIGSIGVIALHIDQSAKDAQEGYRYTAVTAGTHKNDFSPHHPLSDAAKAELQTEVDRLYGLFVEHVAAMRSLDADAVRATEAGLYFGANAITAGLADAVSSFETALTDFSLFLSARNHKPPQARERIRTEAVIASKENAMQENETPLTEMIGVDQAAVLVAEARREAVQSAQAIAELCLIAGCHEQAAGFIAAGKSESDVRRVLCEARAARSEVMPIHSTITPEADTEVMHRPELSPVVAAVKKLTTKE